ncbi:hypothetical protein L5515_000011 [Caenorhabditis briggsae]|nr:hypothetical protein L3Y34_013916 [Caenorhabditis briggsae]UMM10066.1 hypothetical protein L5515_000011 [Caenorhabditis briggsae]
MYYFYILRFALKFGLNALRYAFKFDRRSCQFSYDGELENEGVPDQQADLPEEMMEEAETSRYDSKAGIISMDHTPDVPFGEPSCHPEPFDEENGVKPQMPILVPFAAPHYEPQSLPEEVDRQVPPPNDWINALQIVVEYNKGRFRKLEAEVRELKEEIRRRKTQV